MPQISFLSPKACSHFFISQGIAISPFSLLYNTPYLAPHSSTLAWKIPWMEESGRLAVHGVARSRTRLSDFTFTFHFHALEKEMATHSSVLAWRIPGTWEPGGLPSMVSHRVGHNWSDLAAAAARFVNISLQLFISLYWQSYCWWQTKISVVNAWDSLHEKRGAHIK